jgi:hypothetical protein
MPELVDGKTVIRLLEIGPGTLAHLIERGDLEPYTYAPGGKRKRNFFLKARVEQLAEEGWRRSRGETK